MSYPGDDEFVDAYHTFYNKFLNILDLLASRLILVKVVLFQLRGCDHPQDEAMANFFPDSKSSILGQS